MVVNGIYFEQGETAAKQARCWADAARLCPYGQREGLEAERRQVWMNGFAYGMLDHLSFPAREHSVEVALTKQEG